MQITTKFSKGDRAYFCIFATATIYAVTIENVYLRSNQVLYDIVRTDTDYSIEGVPESDLNDFITAKAVLVKYLSDKLAATTALVAP